MTSPPLSSDLVQHLLVHLPWTLVVPARGDCWKLQGLTPEIRWCLVVLQEDSGEMEGHTTGRGRMHCLW